MNCRRVIILGKTLSWQEAVEQAIEDYFAGKDAELDAFVGEEPTRIHCGSRTYLWAWEIKVHDKGGDWGNGMYAIAISNRNNVMGVLVAHIRVLNKLVHELNMERL